jgi:hypothetical protein
MKIAKTLLRVLAIFMPILVKTPGYFIRFKLDGTIKSDVIISFGGGSYRNRV